MIPVHRMSKVEIDRRNLDSNDAPNGYTAILKYDADNGKNFCFQCDYRKDCIENSGKHPCQDYKRNDSCSVIFRKVQ